MVYCPTQAKHFLVKAPESPAGHLPSVPPDVLPVLQDQQVMVEPNWTRQSKLKTRIRIFPCIICASDKLLKVTNKFYIKFQNKKSSLVFQNNSTKGEIHKLRCLKIQQHLKISNFIPPHYGRFGVFLFKINMQVKTV